jgi:hypothetical protein
LRQFAESLCALLLRASDNHSLTDAGAKCASNQGLGVMTTDPARRADAAAIVAKDARLQRLHAYWLERCAGRAMPTRADVDPLDFAYILGNVVLLGVEREPLRFRVRLQGTEIVQRLGFDLTGRTLDELTMPGFRALIAKAVVEVATHGMPLLRQRNMIMDDRLLRYEAVLLPLGGESGLVEHVMIGVLINGA